MKKNTPSLNPVTAAALILAALAVQPVFAATDYWLGGVSSGDWNNGAHWLSGNAPAAFDSLVFTNQTSVSDTASNDFPAGTVFDGITFSNSSAGSTLILNGNGILLSGATNGVSIGITNATALAEAVSNNLALDWGNYSFYSPAGSLSLNGTLTPNTGGIANIGGSNIKSTSLATDAGGLISSLEGAGLIGNTGVGGGFTGLATISGGTISAYSYPASSQYGEVTLPAFTTSSAITNIEETSTAAGNVVLNSTANQYINTVFISNNTANKVTFASANSGTLVLGNDNGVGGIYLLSASGIGQGLTIGGGTSCILTAGTTSSGGTIVFGINGTTTGNQAEMDATIANNSSSGKVAVVKTGTGSMYFATSGNSYTGGTYVDQGYLQINNSTASSSGGMGPGPVYVAGGAEIYLQTATGVYTNNFYLSPGAGVTYSQSGDIKIGNGSTTCTIGGTVNLLGAPVSSAPGDTIGCSGSSGTIQLTNQITGTGTLEVDMQAGTGDYVNFYFGNISGNANNWTGGLLINPNDSSNGSIYAKDTANNQLNGNNVTIYVNGTGISRLDLNGSHTDTIGGLNSGSPGSGSIQVDNSESGTSTLTIGANNASGSFAGSIKSDSGPLNIIKIGTGTQTLTAVNTYTSSTVVEGGILALTGSGSISSTPITISNAIFNVSQVTGGWSIGNSQVLSVENSGTMTASTIASDTSATVISLTNSTLNLSGSLVGTPASPVNTFNINGGVLNLASVSGSTTNISAGTFNANGAITINITNALPITAAYPTNFCLASAVTLNNAASITVNILAPASPAYVYTVQTIGNAIFLHVTGGPRVDEPLTWNGIQTADNNWTLSLTEGNWLGSGTTYFQFGDFVTFNDDASSGAKTVNLNINVQPGSVTFNNTNVNYTLSGTGSIGGVSSLAKQGSGTVTLTESGGDSFSGGVLAGGGSLVLSNINANISGGVAVTNGTLTLAHSGTIAGGLSVNNTAGGSPSALVIGSGTLTGGLTVNGGTALLDQTTTPSGNLTINSGTVQAGNNDGNGNLPSGTITDSGTLIFDRSDSAMNVSAVISGVNGVLTNNGSGTVTLSGTPNACATTVNSGILELNAGGGNGCISNSILVNAGGELDLNASDSLGYNSVLPGITNSGIIKKLNSQSETLGRPIILAGGTLLTTLTNVEQFETYANYIQTAPGTTNFISGPGKFGLRTSACYLSLGTNSLLTISCVIDTNVAANAGSPAPLNVQGQGTLVLSATNTFTGGVNLNGGIVNVSAAEHAGIAGPLGQLGTITFNGGTLQYSATNTFDYSSRFAGGGQYNIDTAGQNITYATELGYGSVTKLGLGTLTLSGANTYNGNTVISAGKLITTTASTGSGNYLITNGAVLDVQVAGVGAQLNLNGLTLGTNSSDTSTLQIDTLATGNPTAAPVNVTGTVTTNGTVNIQLSGTALAVGTFPLISYTGATPYGALNLITSPRVSATLSDNGTSLISVTITAADPAIEWLGGVSGNWDTNDSANLIWQGINSHTLTYFIETNSGNDAVQFDDNATGTTAVSLTQPVAPTVVTVTNAAKNYTISGSGMITGLTGVNKLGPGTLVLTESGGDSFSGGVLVGGGSLVLSNTSVNISGGLSVTNGILTLAHSGIISGGLSLNNTAGGSPSALVIGSGTLTGGLNVNGGTALLDQTTVPSGTTTVGAGGTVQVGNNDGNGNLPSGTITNDGALVFDRSDAALNVAAVISGYGSVTNIGGGTVTLDSGNNSISGGVTINNGTLQVSGGGGNSSLGNGNTTVNAGGTLVGTNADAFGYEPGPDAPTTIFINGGTVSDAATPNYRITLPNLTFTGGTLTSVTDNSGDANGNYSLLGNGTACTVTTIGTNTTALINAGHISLQEPTTFNLTAGDVTGGATPGVDLLITSVIVPYGVQPLTLTGTGTLELSGTNTFGGTVNINGGVLIAGAPETPGVSGPLGVTNMITFGTFGGGTLEYSASNTFDYSSRFSTAAGQQYSIDVPAGLQVSFGSALASSGGSLAKLDQGTLTLTHGDNFSSGNTTVGGGLLITPTSSDTGNYLVTNSATLDVQVVNSGTTLNMSSLTLGGNGSDTSTLKIDTLATGNPSVAPVNVTGTLAVNGTVNIQLSGTALAVGTSIPLITYSSENISGTLNLITSPRVTATLTDNNAGLISVTITAADPSIEWLGGVSGNWDVNDTGNDIWQGINSHTSTYFIETNSGNDAVTFDDNATGTTVVNLTTNLIPTVVTVTNVAKSYTFSGPGMISGITALTKAGTNSLTVATTNSYSGGTAIGAGIVDAQNGSALGTGAASVASGAALQVDGSNLNIANPLTLNGTGIANGGALLNLANNNTNSGAVILGGATRINSDAGTLTLNSGTAMTGAFGLTVGGSGNTTIASVIATTTGTLTKDGSGALTNAGANSFTGGANINGGILNAAVANALGASGTISFGGGTLQYPVAGNTTDYSSRFSGASGQQYNIDVPIGVSVTCATALTSSGSSLAVNELNDTGTLILSAADTFTGPITVYAGTFRANNVGAFNGNTITEAANGAEIYHNSAGTYSGNYNIIGFGNSEGDPANTHLGAIRLATASITLSGTITLTGNAGITSRGSGTTGDTISGQITGNYGARFNSTSTSAGASTGTLILSDPANNWTGDTTIADGTLKLGASGVIPNGTGFGNVIMTNAGVLFIAGIAPTVFDLNGFSQTINGLSHAISGSDPSQLGLLMITNSGASSATLTVGNNNASGNYGGIIGNGANALALTKIGTGTQTLSGTGTYTGSTTVSAGALAVDGSLGATTVSVASTAALYGNGSIGGNVSVNAGGTISPGAGAGSVGTLTVASGTVGLGGTAYMEIDKALSPSNDLLTASTILYGGTLTVTNLDAGHPLAAGDSFKFFNTTFASFGTFTATNLPVLGGGLAWVTTNLANGVLSIVATVNTNPTNLMAVVSNGTLTLSWPSDHTGWRLLVQTNSLSTGLNPASNAWSTVTGSTTVNIENITLNPANGTVFYRMVYP